MALINRRFNSLSELQERAINGLEVFGNKNNLSSFDNETEILIVGTYIPHDLDYFYFGKYNHRIYGSIIDVVRKTSFDKKRKTILESNNKEEMIKRFIENLRNQKIAFLDLFEYTLINPELVSDKSIKGFVIDTKSFEKVKKSIALKLIVPISKDAKEILESIIGNDPRIEYHQLINGGTNAEWIDVFKREL